MAFADFLGGDSGFGASLSGFFNDPQKMLALAQFGKGISPTAIYGGKEQPTAGARIADAVIPGLQGDVMQQKGQNVSSALSNNTKEGTIIPGKASAALGDHTFDLSDPNITGITHSVKPDGTASWSIKSPGPPAPTPEETVIQQQQQAAGLPTGTPASAALGNQSPFASSQRQAGVVGGENIPAGTLAARNNNPGNLKFVGQPGAVLGERGFARFDSPAAGWQALSRQIELDKARGHTLGSFITKYAPPATNDTAAYIAKVAAATGATADTPLVQLDTNTLAKQIAIAESGSVSGSGIAPIASNGQVPIQTRSVPVAPPIEAAQPRYYSGYLGAPVRGLSPEQVVAAQQMGIAGAKAPYDMAHMAAQTALTETQAKAVPINAANTQAQTEAIRVGLPTKQAQQLTLPGGQKVNVTGEDILKYQIALNTNAIAQQELQLRLEQAKSTNDMREAIAGMRKMQEEELRLKNMEREAKTKLIQTKDAAGEKVPGSELSYGEAEKMGVLTELLKQSQQTKALEATTERQRAHDARALYSKLATDIQTPALARQLKMTTQQYISQQMEAMVGPNWKEVTGIAGQSVSNIPDPLGIRKK